MTRRSIVSLFKRKIKKTIKENYPYALFHVYGCNNIAFYYKKKPTNDTPISAKNVIYPDGYIPNDGDDAYCHTCKLKLTPNDMNLWAFWSVN